MLTKREENQLRALERMLRDEPQYPRGTFVRRMQDKRDELLAKKEEKDG